MVYKCCVPGCKTGYKTNDSKEKIALYRFPKEHELKQKWIKVIPRKDWIVTESSRVCSLHFHENDFVTDSCDTRIDRMEVRGSSTLQRKRLKSVAVPRVFLALPQYLTKASSVPRKTASSASARLKKENSVIEQQNQNLFQQEVIKNFASFKTNIQNEVLPSGYVVIFKESNIQFHYIAISEDFTFAPKLLSSVVVTDALEVQAYVCSAVLPRIVYKHLFASQCLTTISELTNLLALCKSLCSKSFDSISHTQLLELAASCLEQCASIDLTICNENTCVPLLKFIVEQISLLQVPKNARRYSTNTITTAFLWQLTSSSLYKKLRNFFVLPCRSRLRQLSTGMTVDFAKLDLEYLRLRTSELSQRERIVVLMMDEVYTAQRVEYTSGSFIGLTEEGQPAKTVLTFMVQSISGKYKDVVCLIPVEKLDTNLLKSWFERVMLALNDIFFVVAVSADNHVCNRKLFVDLCGGKLSHSIEHPLRKEEKLFLFFDFTHNLKNIYNNFVKRKRMHLPCTGHEHLLGQSCIAEFHHLSRLYAMEEDKALKVAHKLKKSSLNPSSISRTSPLHALSVFNESTVRGLEHYSTACSAFSETARYINFVTNIWKVMSVKTCFKGEKKRDPMFIPLSISHETNHVGLLFLKEATKIFEEWRVCGTAGLSNETFTACIQSMGAVVELATYLQTNHGFDYLLSGKVMSDPIEGRFGWYRQVNGGNFFISVKQLLLAEKKIRCLSLLQQQTLLAASRISDIFSNDDDGSEVNEEQVWLADFFLGIVLEDMSESDAAIAYYVSGYIARSIVRRTKCCACKELLIKGDDEPDLKSSIPNEHKHLFEMANRGGLCEPSEFCFGTTVLAAQCYQAIINDPSMMRKFLSLNSHQRAFVDAIKKMLCSSKILVSLLNTKCSTGHCNFDLIVQCAFNCFSKNQLKRFNSQPTVDTPQPKLLRKIRKLTSKASSSS